MFSSGVFCKSIPLRPRLPLCLFPGLQSCTHQPPGTHPPHLPCCLGSPLSQVYLDVKVEGDKIGRIVIDLFDDVRVGSQRFADLAEGKEGVGYRLSKFDGIFPVCVSGCGVFVALQLSAAVPHGLLTHLSCWSLGQW